MSSKKLGCPLTSIFQQWIAQHQRQHCDIESHQPLPLRSYRILLQTSYSLKARITAAEPVENPHLYKCAGLATPSERANRDIHGTCETSWLLRLVELAAQQQQRHNEKVINCDDSTTDAGSIIFLTTKRRSQENSIVQELPEDLRREVQVIDAGSRDSFGWDERNKSIIHGKNDNFVSVDNLRQLYRRLQQKLNEHSNSGKQIILIWQSLTPLILIYGFQNVFRLLCALPTSLQIWPVNLHVMTPQQRKQLEDASNAILYLHDGELNIIRQGIRERGNVLRQKIPFRLEAIDSNRHKQCRFRIVEAEGEDLNNGDDHKASNATTGRNKIEKGSNSIVLDKKGSTEPSTSGGRSSGAHLQLEESDGGRNKRVGENLSAESEFAVPDRPRIYLEDDDPEFDDFDEEDPDDDLDI